MIINLLFTSKEKEGKMRKIKAAVVTEFSKPLQMKSFDSPKLHKGQVLVKIIASGVCGSDVHMWKGFDSRVFTPIILGHEGIGIIGKIAGEKTDIFHKLLHNHSPFPTLQPKNK